MKRQDWRERARSRMTTGSDSVPDHPVEVSDDLSGLDKGGNASLDGGDSDCLCLRECISSRRTVMRRAIVLADGIRRRVSTSAFSDRRLRVDHSLTSGAKVQRRFDSRLPIDRRAMAGADRANFAGSGRHHGARHGLPVAPTSCCSRSGARFVLRRSAAVRSSGSIVVPRLRCGSDPSICGRHRRRPDWRSPSDANDLRLAPRAAARRVVDRNVLHLIKMWLRAPIEERDADETRCMSGGKRNTRGTPQGGVASPLLANIYMNRFLKHWRLTESGDTFRAHVVSYAERLRYPQPRSGGGGIGVDEGGDDQARVDDQQGENFVQKRPTGTLRLPRLLVRRALV